MPEQTDGTTQDNDQLGWHMTGNAGEVADILTIFAQELKHGDINVWKGQRELHLDPSGRIELRVHATTDDKGQENLRLELSWITHSPAENALGGGMSFSDTQDLTA